MQATSLIRVRSLTGFELVHVKQAPIERWLDTLLDYSPYTVDNYRQLLTRLDHVLGFPIEHANLDDLLKAIRWFKEVRGYAGSSMKSLCAALRSFLRFVGRNADADEIPTFSTRWLPPEPPTPEQIDEVLRYATLKEQALILAFYSTAARSGELLGDTKTRRPPVCIEDIDWHDGRIRIIGKGGHADYLIFWIRRDETIRTLLERLNGRQVGPLFPFCDSYARRLVRNAGRRVGVKLYPHLLRHACATSLLRQGVDCALVSTHLRHVRLDTTKRYLSITKHDLIARAREKDWR